MTEHTADTRPPLLPGAHGAGIGITTFGTLFIGFSGTHPASSPAALRMRVLGRIELACQRQQTKLLCHKLTTALLPLSELLIKTHSFNKYFLNPPIYQVVF